MSTRDTANGFLRVGTTWVRAAEVESIAPVMLRVKPGDMAATVKVTLRSGRHVTGDPLDSPEAVLARLGDAIDGWRQG